MDNPHIISGMEGHVWEPRAYGRGGYLDPGVQSRPPQGGNLSEETSGDCLVLVQGNGVGKQGENFNSEDMCTGQSREMAIFSPVTPAPEASLQILPTSNQRTGHFFLCTLVFCFSLSSDVHLSPDTNVCTCFVITIGHRSPKGRS